MRVPSGQPVRLDFEVRELSLPDGTPGPLVTPGSVKLELLGPPTYLPVTLDPPTTDGVGLYHSELDAVIEPFGHYEWKFSTTAPGKTVQSGSLDVYDPLAPEVLSLEVGKDYLGIAESDHTFDDRIASMIRALTPTIEFFAGPVTPVTLRRTVPGGFQSEIVLPVAPVLSLVAVSSVGALLVVDDLTLDLESGIVRHTLPGSVFPWGPVVFEFVAGRRVIPDAISQAAKVILDHLFETQRGRGSTYAGNRRQTSDTTFVPALGYSVPNRAIELLKPLSMKTGLS